MSTSFRRIASQTFLVACREIIPQAKTEFLNVTLRYVAADNLRLLLDIFSGAKRSRRSCASLRRSLLKVMSVVMRLTEALI